MSEINWKLLQQLHDKPHPLLNIADDFEKQIREIPIAWTGEVFQEARSAHHLLDMIGIPQGKGYSSDLDARTYLAIREVMDLRERLGRIAEWHSRESGPGGLVGDLCTECGQTWLCDTRKMADGTYEEPDDGECDDPECFAHDRPATPAVILAAAYPDAGPPTVVSATAVVSAAGAPNPQAGSVMADTPAPGRKATCPQCGLDPIADGYSVCEVCAYRPRSDSGLPVDGEERK